MATLGLLPLAALLACVQGEPADPAAPAGPTARPAPAVPTVPLKAVCTTAMVADAVQSIAGEDAAVEVLMGEGVDPHLYKPTASDVKAITGADIVFVNGLMLEGRMQDVLSRAAANGKRVVMLGDGVPEERLRHGEGSHGAPDPHIWMDPATWAFVAAPVSDAMCAARPEHADRYREAAAAYRAQMEVLAREFTEILATIPRERRLLVTAHDAFGYFGRAFDLEVAGIQGISTDSESGIADIQRLVDRIVERGVPAVFAETSVPDKAVQALIEGARARGHELRLGGYLYSDAMGKPGTPDGTLPGMVRANAVTISKALGGNGGA